MSPENAKKYMTNQTKQEAKRLYSCIMYDFHDVKDRQEMWEREIRLVINTEVTAVLNELEKEMNDGKGSHSVQVINEAIQSIRSRYE